MDKDSDENIEPTNLNDAYQQALDKTAIVGITDLNGSIIYVNDKFCEISKFTREELIGKNHNILKSGYHTLDFYKDLWRTIKKGDVWMGQIKNKAKDGSYYWVQTTIVPMLDAEQKPFQYLSFRLDITEQKLAEEQRAESEKRLRLVADNFPNGSISLIDKDLNILFTAGAGYEAVDFRPEQVTGKPLKNAVSPPTIEFLNENLPQILEGKTLTQEVFTRNRYYQNIYRPIIDQSGDANGFVMVALDDTENKKKTLEIRRHNELFAIGEELAKIGSWDWDLDTGNIVFSSNTLRLLGHDPAVLERKSREVLEWVHPDDRKMLEESVRKMLDTNTFDVMEFRMIRKDGKVRIFQSSSTMNTGNDGQQKHVIGVLKDITEKRKSEQELLESKEILSKIADSIPGLVMRYVEREDGTSRIQYVSKGAESLWEVTQEEIHSDVSIVWNKVHQDDVLGFLRSFKKSKNTLTPWNYEFRIVMGDGRIKWVSVIGTPKSLDSGGLLWDILALDVTSRKTAEVKIERNMELLTFQNTQLLDFCNIVSHNLRSPLVNMSMLVGFIEESADERERKVYIDKLKPVIEGLNETFEELVESIQIQQDREVRSEQIDIEETFWKIIAGFEGQITLSNAIIEADFSGAPVLYYPPKYWSSILHNLISNALKYRSPDRRLNITVKTARTQKKILLTVKDNGLGLDLKKHQSNLFKIRKVFHRHPDAKGFGLYITKSQVEAMKGRIWIESIPDVGSTFFVEFNNQ
jgi:PAS domain S-box-containing protein